MLCGGDFVSSASSTRILRFVTWFCRREIIPRLKEAWRDILPFHMSGFFDVLQQDDSDESQNEGGPSVHGPIGEDTTETTIPSYEDLSTTRTDEETVLAAVYGDEFSSEVGVWGCKRLSVLVKPPDVDQDQIGNQLT